MVANDADAFKEYNDGKFNPESYSRVSAPKSTFIRMIVLEVVSDPNNELMDENRKSEWQSQRISNMKYVDILPRNTIIAKQTGADVDPMFVFPFFPSHFSMPCKPGECVWVMLEKPENVSDMAFWFCRITEPHMSDDVNHSHPGRSFETSNFLSHAKRMTNAKTEKASGVSGVPEINSEEVWHELRNGPVKTVPGENGEPPERITARNISILHDEPEDVFETLITKTRSSSLMSYEAVPRFRKRPGDIVLEGSNNSLIVLGTDRVGPLEPPANESGTIDIVVGRGQKKYTFGNQVSTTSITNAKGKQKGTELKKELDKTRVVSNEGDPDFISDRSRILVSQTTNVDLNFGLKRFGESLKPPVKDSAEGDAAIVIKSDKVRMIARSDIEIIVSDSKTMDAPNGKKVKDENDDTNKWASIVIRSNGDIILTPSANGILKLGGDDADKAVLCSPAIIAAGQVSALPLTDTMGGSLGVKGANPTGVFATKVVFK